MTASYESKKMMNSFLPNRFTHSISMTHNATIPKLIDTMICK